MKYLNLVEVQGRIELEYSDDFLIYRQGSGNTIEILDINIGSERRRKGLGRKLVDLLFRDKLPPETVLVWAITRADNFKAQQFYEKLRFRIVANLRNFYQDTPDRLAHHGTVDAILFGRDVGSKA